MYREKAVSDAIAGVTVGLTVIPQVNLVSIVINIVLAPLLLLLLLPLFFCQVNMIITRASPMQWWLGSSLNMVFTPPSWDALPIASLAGATSRIRSQPFYKYLRIIYKGSSIYYVIIFGGLGRPLPPYVICNHLGLPPPM